MVANPASGKDVRRLVARASVFDNQEKQAIVGRTLAGMTRIPGADPQLAYLNDSHGLVRTALTQVPCCNRCVTDAKFVSARDTTIAAQQLAQLGARVVITLGGDGTNRAFALGWQDAPLIPISTGTNNVFPQLLEATVAGAAAGLIACGHVALSEVATRQKLILVEIDDEADDLALIDAVLVDDRFVGSRALLAPGQLQLAMLTRADPASVGICAIGGLLDPVGADEAQGLLVTFGGASANLLAPLAPGHYVELAVREHQRVEFDQPVQLQGPGVVALDGERERVLKPGQRATFTLNRLGPWLVDVNRTLQLAAQRDIYQINKGS